MNDYTFSNCFRSTGDLRVDDVVFFLRLMKDTLSIHEFFDCDGRTVDLNHEDVSSLLSAAVVPTIGANVDLFSKPPNDKDPDTMCFPLHTGAEPNEIIIDFMNAEVGPRTLEVCCVESIITHLDPFESYISEYSNWKRLNVHNRECDARGFTRPVVIHGIHYFDCKMAEELGGMGHCLNVPAWKVHEIGNGVLIQLVAEPFDSENAEHLAAQHDAMSYFGMV